MKKSPDVIKIKNILTICSLFRFFNKLNFKEINKIYRRIKFNFFWSIINLKFPFFFLIKKIYKVQNKESLDKALLYNKGVLIPILNFKSNWQIIRFLIKEGYIINLIVDNIDNKVLAKISLIIKIYRKINNKAGFARIFSFYNSEAQEKLSDIYRQFGRNELFIIFFENYKTNKQNNTIVKFLNDNYAFNNSFFNLAKRSNIPVLPVNAYKKNIFKEVIEFGNCLLLDKKEYKSNIEQIVNFFEKAILKYPENWFGWHIWGLNISKNLNNESRYNNQKNIEMAENPLLKIDSNRYVLFRIDKNYYFLNKVEMLYFKISKQNVFLVKKLFNGIHAKNIVSYFDSQDEFEALLKKLNITVWF